MIRSVDQCSPKGFESFAKTGSCLNESDLEQIKKHADVAFTHRKIKAKFRTETPKKWLEKGQERTWLTNRDIDHVMKQYNNTHFVYMGAMPVDFATVLPNGSCVRQGMCKFDLKKLKNKSFAFVFNLDVHSGSGTHWTALYGSADSSNVKYGVFFFCSYGRQPPFQVKMFMDELVTWMEQMHPGIPLSLGYNQKRYQRKNSECGMFSCAFLIRCLENDSETYKDALGTMGDDENMFQLRKLLFRIRT